jgi:hypothetical protein
MASTMKNEEGALRGAPSLEALRHARAELRQAIADGAEHLRPVADEVEDVLIEQLAARGREREVQA